MTHSLSLSRIYIPHLSVDSFISVVNNKMSGYAPSTPFDEGYLPVDEIHKLFYQQYGKKDGKPGEHPHQAT